MAMSEYVNLQEIRDRVRECLEEKGSFRMASEADELIEAFRKSGLEISIVTPNRPVQVS